MKCMNGFQYRLRRYPDGFRTMSFTWLGLRDLTAHERSRIEIEFQKGRLGDEIEIVEHVAEWERADDEPDKEIASDQPEPEDDCNLADRLLERQKDDRWAGTLGLVYDRV